MRLRVFWSEQVAASYKIEAFRKSHHMSAMPGNVQHLQLLERTREICAWETTQISVWILREGLHQSLTLSWPSCDSFRFEEARMLHMWQPVHIQAKFETSRFAFSSGWGGACLSTCPFMNAHVDCVWAEAVGCFKVAQKPRNGIHMQWCVSVEIDYCSTCVVCLL